MQKIVERFKNFNSRHRKFLPFIIYPEMVVIVFVSILGYLRRRLKIVIPVILVILLAIFFISRAVSSDRHVGDENTEITGVDVAEGNENQANELDGASEAEGGEMNDSDISSGTSTEKPEEVEQRDTEQTGNAEKEDAELDGTTEQEIAEQAGNAEQEDTEKSENAEQKDTEKPENAEQRDTEKSGNAEQKNAEQSGDIEQGSAKNTQEAEENTAEQTEAENTVSEKNDDHEEPDVSIDSTKTVEEKADATQTNVEGNEASDSAAADTEVQDSGATDSAVANTENGNNELPDQETNSSEAASASSPIINPIIVSDSDINKVFEAYPESVAWIRFEDGLISYPVMQSSDNNKYTIKDYTGSDSDTGAIFLDYRSSDSFNDPNTIIYGHNMRDYSMFGAFKYYKNDLTFLKDHKYFQIITPEGTSRYMIFAYMNVPKNSDIYNMVGNSSDKMRGFLDTIEYRTFIDTGIEPTVEDKIITLSTCTQSDNLHFVMFAVKTTD